MNPSFGGRMVLLMVLTALSLPLLTGCGNNQPVSASAASSVSSVSAAAPSEAASDIPKNALIGQWSARSVENAAYTFLADGTGQYCLKDTVIPLQYTVKDNRITIHYQEQNELTAETSVITQDYEYELNDTVLNIKDPFGTDNFYDKTG